ncbi:DUF1192 domain-containing protein [Alterisphingorhabdus coralli]|uniref:DUF1192 domain-containing protein n=1 Tax=Alterisphingorhabdus coralli TaxID=3071408 RepID=A0AA97I2R7_9SPHN|nr:DUF1192 domain-containing protein [Parasphingorhabdus sp. SCSIO 66989]WOE76695.1 DUF1192 domain-containing protein [Parasphingorhabdus sp. SCSIO 66989]
MDLDENLPRRKDQPLEALVREDLDPLSLEELDSRIAVLEAEIARCKAHKAKASDHRASAEALFKK